MAAAAEAAVPELQASLDEYDKIKLPNTWDMEKLQPVLDEKKARYKEIQAEARTFMGTYSEFNYIMACLYITADVVQGFVEMIYDWEPGHNRDICGPPTEDNKLMCEDLLAEQKTGLAEAFELEAISLYDTVIQEATNRKQNSPWVTRAREALHAVDPNTYPLLKPDRVQYDNAPYEAAPAPAVAPAEETS